jgi:hypothetical protein
MRGRITVDPDSMERGLAKSLFGSALNLYLTKFYFFFFVKIECGLYFLNCFNVLILKIIFKN